MQQLVTNYAPKAFVCVYQHTKATADEKQLTAEERPEDPLLQSFLTHYDELDCFYDWGDDPSFFAATHLLGNPAAASWGVCRSDVRKQLRRGDFIVWFCAKYDLATAGRICYFFIGCTTVLYVVGDRRHIWTERRYMPYRKFYNVLARLNGGGALEQYETFHRFHNDDWQRRATAPYIIFDPDPTMSVVDLNHPLLVACREPRERLETWRNGVVRVAKLRRVLLSDNGIPRNLRTNNLQQTHRQIALHKYVLPDQLPALRAELVLLAKR
jgi:hypothetical protein